MDVEFTDPDLDRLETDASRSYGSPALTRAFRKLMQLIRSATDERDFYNMKSLRFEKLKGQRAGQCSMRLNDQYRLIVRIKEAANKKTVQVLGIADYH